MKKKAILSLFLCAILMQVQAQEKITLTLFAFHRTQGVYPPAETLQKLFSNFMRDNPDIVINTVEISNTNDYVKDVEKLFSENKAPELLFTWGGQYLNELAVNGKLLDLTFYSNRLNFCEAAKDTMSVNGRLYGVAPLWSIAGIYINENKMKEFGLAVPQTIEELEKTSDVFLSHGIQPFASGAGDGWPLSHVYSYLVERFTENPYTQAVTKRKMRFDSEPFVKAALKIQEWSRKGYFGEDPRSEYYGQSIDLMCEGKAGMQVTGTWMNSTYNDKKKTNQSFIFVPFPVIPGGNGNGKRLLALPDLGFAASYSALPKKEAVIRFFEYVLGTDLFKENSYDVSAVPRALSDHPLIAMENEILQQADRTQPWWDQNLPGELKKQFFDMVNTFADPSTDVRAALAKMEDSLTQKLGPVKK